MTQVRTIDRRGVTDENTFPISMPEYEDVDGLLVLNLKAMNEVLDVLERIQQQLGQINNSNNLEPGERFN